MKRFLLPLVFLASLALALSLAGCGDSAETAESALSRLTPAQLDERMGDICQKHTDKKFTEIGRWEKKHGLPRSAYEDVPDAQYERELMQIQIPDVRETIRELERKLRPPKSEEKTFKAFLAALEYGIEFSEKDPSWYPTGYTEPFSKARALAWKLGTAYCGQA